MSSASTKGVWKSGSGRGRSRPKGRQVEDLAWSEVKDLLGEQPRRRDLLIEFLHLIQDVYGHISAAHMWAHVIWQLMVMSVSLVHLKIATI